MIQALFLLLAVGGRILVQDLVLRVDAIAEPYIESGQIVGMAIGIIPGRGAEPVVLGYGKIDLDSGGVPNGDTVFEIGSITKVFTGVLLATLIQDETVRLDQPVQELLDDSVGVPAYGGTEITLEHLATHTSSLPRMPGNFEPGNPHDPFADYTLKMMYEFLSNHRLPRHPGKRFEYSNLGMGLLGHALARQAGRSYEQLLVERIAGPLGMKSTRVALTDDMRRRLAPGYDGQHNPAQNWHIVSVAGAGGIRSTVNDLLLFLQANWTLDASPLADALAKARTIHHEPAAEEGQRMGLGWLIAPNNVRWHNGQTGGYSAIVGLDLDARVAVVVLANTATRAVDEVSYSVGLLLSGAPNHDELQVDATVLSRYAGRYVFTRQFVLTVTHEGGRLMVQATGQPKYQVYPQSPTKFAYRVADAQISFVEDDSGKVSGLILHQGGLDQYARRED